MILDLPCTASQGGIRSTYRNLAKKLHPDVAGEEATHAFQEISESNRSLGQWTAAFRTFPILSSDEAIIVRPETSSDGR